MSPRLATCLAVSHAAAFAAAAWVTYRMRHVRWSANPTGWWWEPPGSPKKWGGHVL